MNLNQIMLDNPAFGLVLTIGFFLLYARLFRNMKNPFFSPLIFTIVSIIAVLQIFDIPVACYNHGGDLLTFMLGPATVALALPLYRRIYLLQKHFIPIMLGFLIGTFTGIVSVVLIGRLFGLEDIILLSLSPKATTTPIAMELSRSIGGEISLTLAFVIVAGLSGFIMGEKILQRCRIKSAAARGIALGTASHVVGTGKAMEMGAEEGAMSSLAIAMAGLITGLILPATLALLNL